MIKYFLLIGLIVISSPIDAIANNISLRNSTDTCSSSTEGAIRYVSTTQVFEGCDGSSWNNISGSSGLPTSEYYTSSGTFTVPAGVTKVKFTVAGAGGGGASYTNNGADGGASSISINATTVTANGGTGGKTRATSGTATHGTATGGDLNIAGGGATGAMEHQQNTAYNFTQGGHGGYAIKTVTVSPGDSATITVGTGGAGGADGTYPGVAGVNGYVIAEY
jgi:hypothetical protein